MGQVLRNGREHEQFCAWAAGYPVVIAGIAPTVFRCLKHIAQGGVAKFNQVVVFSTGGKHFAIEGSQTADHRAERGVRVEPFRVSW